MRFNFVTEGVESAVRQAKAADGDKNVSILGASIDQQCLKLNIVFDVTYFIQKTGPEPKIIMFIDHQDEERAMKELGLLG